jgi:hypothetical protein
MTMTLKSKLRDCLRWAQLRCEARGRPQPQITLASLSKMWDRQRGRCALTGTPMEMSGSFSATIDRINPTRGYCRDNVVLVTLRANQAKGNMTMREFRRLCRQVLGTGR